MEDVSPWVAIPVLAVVAAMLVFMFVWLPWHYHGSEIKHAECVKCDWLRWRARRSSARG